MPYMTPVSLWMRMPPGGCPAAVAPGVCRPRASSVARSPQPSQPAQTPEARKAPSILSPIAENSSHLPPEIAGARLTGPRESPDGDGRPARQTPVSGARMRSPLAASHSLRSPPAQTTATETDRPASHARELPHSPPPLIPLPQIPQPQHQASYMNPTSLASHVPSQWGGTVPYAQLVSIHDRVTPTVALPQFTNIPIYGGVAEAGAQGANLQKHTQFVIAPPALVSAPVQSQLPCQIPLHHQSAYDPAYPVQHAVQHPVQQFVQHPVQAPQQPGQTPQQLVQHPVQTPQQPGQTPQQLVQHPVQQLVQHPVQHPVQFPAPYPAPYPVQFVQHAPQTEQPAVQHTAEHAHHVDPQYAPQPSHAPQASHAPQQPAVSPTHREHNDNIILSVAPQLDPSNSSSPSSTATTPHSSPEVTTPVPLKSKRTPKICLNTKEPASVDVNNDLKPSDKPAAGRASGGGRIGKQPVRDPNKLKHRVWLQQNRTYQGKLHAAGFRVLEGVNGSKMCSLCNKHFQKEMFVWRHALSHVSGKPFHCTVCDQKFTRSDTLQRHIRRAGHSALPSS